jgi:hypothetical protein
MQNLAKKLAAYLFAKPLPNHYISDGARYFSIPKLQMQRAIKGFGQII